MQDKQHHIVSKRSPHGFTIVELLIVVVVIAILAAITIVAYNGVQNRTNDSVLNADLANAKKGLELAKIDLGHYPQATSEFPTFHISTQSYDTTLNNVYYIVDTTNQNYAFGVRSKSGKGFILTNSGLSSGVAVNGAATASAIGVTWGAAGTAVFQGFTAPNSWNTTWTWVQ